MNANKYEPVNVLNIFRGFARQGINYHITPYRFSRENGRSYDISEIRHFHQDLKGGHKQLHYHVITKDGSFCRLLFDTGSFTWRLVEERNHDGVFLVQ